jgi:hypothetical protein
MQTFMSRNCKEDDALPFFFAKAEKSGLDLDPPLVLWVYTGFADDGSGTLFKGFMSTKNLEFKSRSRG